MNVNVGLAAVIALTNNRRRRRAANLKRVACEREEGSRRYLRLVSLRLACSRIAYTVAVYAMSDIAYTATAVSLMLAYLQPPDYLQTPEMIERSV